MAGMDRQVWDVFVSYASEDRDIVARPLANSLISQGLSVWFDEHELKVGDSLRDRIDDGLSQSRYGVVILSPAFFQKQWTVRELDGLVQREVAGQKLLLPVWNGVDVDAVRRFSPTLANRVGLPVSRGIPTIASEIVAVVRAPVSSGAVAGSSADPDVLSDTVRGALEQVSYDLLDSLEVSGLIAETNATDFVPDDIDVFNMGPLELATVSAPFHASVHFTGEHDQDRMYLGNAISAEIRGTITFDGDSWEVEDYEVLAAEIEGMDYEPQDA